MSNYKVEYWLEQARYWEAEAKRLQAQGSFKATAQAKDKAEYALSEAIAQEKHAKGPIS